MPLLSEPGTYVAKATRADLGWTSKGGTQVAVALEITEGEHQGEHITWFGFFTEKTRERTIQSLRYLGLRGNDLDKDLGTVRSKAQIVVNEDTWEGKTRLKVQWINELDGGRIGLSKPMDAAERVQFAESMRGWVESIPEQTSLPLDGPPPYEEDDDLPF